MNGAIYSGCGRLRRIPPCLKSPSLHLKTFLSFRFHFAPRTFLTEAHQCDEAWEGVLTETLAIDSDNFERYSINLRDKSNRGHPLSAVEIDTLAHKLQDVEDLSSLDIFESLLNSVRRSSAAADFHLGSSHAIVRGYLDMNLAHHLVDQLLPSKSDYGIFLDPFSALFLLNEFTSKEDWTRCSKIAEDLALQETFFSPLVRRACMLSVFNHVVAGGVDSRREEWETAEEEESRRLDEEEEVLEYYHYRPNGWEDGHFDLRNPSLVVGKTLSMLGKEEGGQLGATFELLGACYAGEAKVVETLDDLNAFDRRVAPYIKDATANRFSAHQVIEAKLKDLKTSSIVVDEELRKLIQTEVESGIDDFRRSYDDMTTSWMEERRTLAEKERWSNREKELRRLATEQLKNLETQEEVLTYFENELKLELYSNMATVKAKEATVEVDIYEKYVRTLHPDLIDLKGKCAKTWYPVGTGKTAKGFEAANEKYYLADYYKKPWWSL